MNWLWKGFLNLIETGVVAILDFFTKNILEAFNYDLTKFLEYFPFSQTAYSIISWFSAALVILFFVFQIYKNYLGPLSDGENQFALLGRSAFAMLLTANGLWICNYILNIIKTPYDALVAAPHTATIFSFDSPWDEIKTSIGKLGSNLVAGPLEGLIGLIAIIVIGWNYIKLILEVIERYVVLGCLSYLSPLAFSTVATKATGNIFKAFCRMFGSECLLMLLNVWFIRGANSAIASLITAGYVEANEVFILHLMAIIAYLRIAQKFDAYLAQLGLNTAQTGGFLGAELAAAGAMIGRAAGHAVEGRGVAGAIFGTNRRGGAGVGGGNGGAFIARNNPNANRGIAANNMANAMNNRNGNAYAGTQPKNGNPTGNAQAIKDANALWGGNGKTVTSVQAGNGRIAATIDNGDGTFTDRRVTQGKDGRYQYKDTPIDPKTGKLDHDKTVKGEERSLAAIGSGFNPNYGIDPAEAKAQGEAALNGSGATLSGDDADVAAKAMFADQNSGNAEFADTTIEEGHMSTKMRNDDGSSSAIDSNRNDDGSYGIHMDNYDEKGNLVGSLDFKSDSVLGGVGRADDVAEAVGALEGNGYDIADDAITYSAEDGFKINATDENGNKEQFSSKENDDGSLTVSAQQLNGNGEPVGDAFSYQSNSAMGGVDTADDVQSAMSDLKSEGFDVTASYSDEDGWKIRATDEDGNTAEITSSQNDNGGYNISAQAFDKDGNAVGDPFSYTSDTEMGGVSDIGEAASVADAMREAGCDNVEISHSAENGFVVAGTNEDGSSIAISSSAAENGGFDMSVQNKDADGNTSGFDYHDDSNFGKADAAISTDREVNAMEAQGLNTSVSQDANGNFVVTATDGDGNSSTYTSAKNSNGSHTVTATDADGNSFSYDSDVAMGGASGAKDFAAEHDLGSNSHYDEHGMSYDSQTGQFSGYGISGNTTDSFNGDGSHSSYVANETGNGGQVTNYDAAGNVTGSYSLNASPAISQAEALQGADAIGSNISSMRDLGFANGGVNIDGNGTRSTEFTGSDGSTVSVSSSHTENGGYRNSVDIRGSDGSHQTYTYDSDAPMQGVTDHVKAHDSFANADFERDISQSVSGDNGSTNDVYKNRATGESVSVQNTPSANGGYNHSVTKTNADGSSYSYDFHDRSSVADMNSINNAYQDAAKNAHGTDYAPIHTMSDGHGEYRSEYKSSSGDTMSVQSARSSSGNGYDHLMTHTDGSGHKDTYSFHSDTKDVPVSEYNKMQESINHGTEGSGFRATAVSRDAQGNYRGTFTNDNSDTMTVNARRNNNGSYNVIYDLKNSQGATIGGNSSYTSQNSPFEGIRGYQTAPQKGKFMYTDSQGNPDPSYYANRDVIASARTMHTNDDGSRIIKYSNGETARVRQNSSGTSQVVSINHSPVSDKRGFTEQSYAPRAQAEAPVTSRPVSQPANGSASSGKRNNAPSSTGSHVFSRNSGGSGSRNSNSGSRWRRFRKK